MFAIIKAKSAANRDSVCIIDGKPVSKGDKVVLLGNKVKGQRIKDWEVAHVAPKCADKIEQWITAQPETATTTTATTTTLKAPSNVNEAFKIVGIGNKKRDGRIELLDTLVAENIELLKEQSRTIEVQGNQITKLMELVRFGDSSIPVRPAADADNKPVNCLGTKTNGQACKQTQNRLQPNGYCGQHQGQSGDSQRAVLDSHSANVQQGLDNDEPAISSDTLELLG